MKWCRYFCIIYMLYCMYVCMCDTCLIVKMINFMLVYYTKYLGAPWSPSSSIPKKQKIINICQKILLCIRVGRIFYDEIMFEFFLLLAKIKACIKNHENFKQAVLLYYFGSFWTLLKICAIYLPPKKILMPWKKRKEKLIQYIIILWENIFVPWPL